jgi:hypothetical protein
MKRYFASAVLLSVLCAAQSLPLAADRVYDRFNGPFLNSSKWLAIPTCSATPFVDTTASVSLLDCARDIQNNKLHLMVRALGNELSDVGRQFGPSELFFVNPNAINAISTNLRVKQSAAIACPSNSTRFSSLGQAIVGGNYFNPGTGNPSDDVAAVLIVEHDPTTPAGVLVVSALVFSPNAFYGFASLGTIRFEQLLTGTVQWDQPNHQFIFHAVGPNLNSTAIVDYAVSDAMQAAAPVKLLGARAFAPNCTTRQGKADIEVLFDSVLVN